MPKACQSNRTSAVGNCTDAQKDKNRKAQADFRQRRVAYLASLEETVTLLEQMIPQLQESNRELSAEVAQWKARCECLQSALTRRALPLHPHQSFTASLAFPALEEWYIDEIFPGGFVLPQPNTPHSIHNASSNDILIMTAFPEDNPSDVAYDGYGKLDANGVDDAHIAQRQGNTYTSAPIPTVNTLHVVETLHRRAHGSIQKSRTRPAGVIKVAMQAAREAVAMLGGTTTLSLGPAGPGFDVGRM